MTNIYEMDLDQNAANHQPLTPLTYLERAAKVYPDHIAIIHGDSRLSYRDFWRRSLQLASALSRQGIGKGDTVIGHAFQHAGDAGGAFRRADGEGRAAFPQHAARRGDHRLSARPCRIEGPDRRPRVLAASSGRRWRSPR